MCSSPLQINRRIDCFAPMDVDRPCSSSNWFLVQILHVNSSHFISDVSDRARSSWWWRWTSRSRTGAWWRLTWIQCMRMEPLMAFQSPPHSHPRQDTAGALFNCTETAKVFTQTSTVSLTNSKL